MRLNNLHGAVDREVNGPGVRRRVDLSDVLDLDHLVSLRAYQAG